MSSSTASVTLARMLARCSTRRPSAPASGPWPARTRPWSCRPVDALEQVGRQVEEAVLEARQRAGYELDASSASAASTLAASLKVLHSSRRASRRSRSSQRASSSSRSMSRSSGRRRLVLSSTSVAAMSRNSVATVEVERRPCARARRGRRRRSGERDLVEVDLLAQDQVQEQVERPLEHRGLHFVRHCRTTIEGPTPKGADPGLRHPAWSFRADQPGSPCRIGNP